MRILIAATILGAALASSIAAQSRPDAAISDSLERPFVANGRIRMDLSAGEYRIAASSDHRIRLSWSVDTPYQLRTVHARADVNGPDASIAVAGPRNHFKVSIEVPMRTDLHVRLTAGELTIGRLLGNKDIGLHAGEVDIDVGNPDEYGRVEASVWAGEIHAGPFGTSKEGLFRSFNWNGKGPYRLNAHLKAGEMRLHAGAGVTPNR